MRMPFKICGRALPVLTGLGILFAFGCKPAPPPPAQKADYSQVLNKYYEGHPMCLWESTVKFPIAEASQEQIDQLGLAALAEAGLLIAKPVHGAAKGAQSFDLSPAGRAAFDPDVFNAGAGNFCYGRRKIASIDAARRNSSTTELVDYHYGVPQPAGWAAEPPIQDAFPHVATELAGPHMAEATLLDTTDGWEISGTPATITPLATRPRTSPLAKAKNLLHHLRKKP